MRIPFSARSSAVSPRPFINVPEKHVYFMNYDIVSADILNSPFTNIEYDEYLEPDEESQKKKIGDLLEGNVSIGLVTYTQKADKELFHCQEIPNSPHIEAVVEVSKVVDEYAVYALSSIMETEILVEFETVIDYQVGDKISVIGSLEIADNDN